MTADILIQTLASGVLIGLIYALVAVGLTMIFGVMDIVNFAHGEFLMLGMYASFWMFSLYALDPLLTLPLTVLMLFAFGMLLYKLVIKRINNAPMLSQIFTTFGLMILLRGVAQFLWKPDFRSIENSWVSGSAKLAGIQLGKPQLVAGVGAVLVTALVHFFLTRTKLGAALEATAADKEAAQLMGIDAHRMFALAWGIGAACAGAAGVLLSTFFPIFPEVGANFILIAFVVVNLGGFGSVTGAFWAGILVGVVEVMGGLLIGPQYKMAVVLVLFLAVLMFRPQGLMGESMMSSTAPMFTKRRAVIGAIVAAALIALPLVTHDVSRLNLFILVLMAAQLGVAWNLLGGYAGQVSLGHAAFYGIGAYTSTLLLLNFGLNPWLGMLAGGITAAALSFAFGWSCFRLKGHYFAMATIAVAEIVQIVFTNWEYAGSAVGLTIPMTERGLGAMVFTDKAPYYWLALGLLALTLGATWAVERSHIGYYLRAIKDEPDAARSIGINIARYKQIALALSAFFTAMGGSLYAQKELYIDPASVLSTALSIKMALVSILGGVGTLFGPVVGSVVLTTIEELTRASFGGSGRGTDTIIYAALIIGIAVFYPSGLLGWWHEWRQRRQARRHAASTTSKEATP